jgi:hypothetical protein
MNEKRSSEFIRKAEEFKNSMREVIVSDTKSKAMILIVVDDDQNGSCLGEVWCMGTERNLGTCVKSMFDSEDSKKLIVRGTKNGKVRIKIKK